MAEGLAREILGSKFVVESAGSQPSNLVHPNAIWAMDQIGIDITSRTEILSVELPPSREAGIIVESVDELIDKLKNEAKVLQWKL